MKERELSLQHWRYRILHWAFNVDGTSVDTATQSMPRFLYTHYCPLFHLTNALLLVSPLIMFGKLVYASIEYMVAVINQIEKVVAKLRGLRRESKINSLSDEDRRQLDENVIRRHIQRYIAKRGLDARKDSIGWKLEIYTGYDSKYLLYYEDSSILDDKMWEIFQEEQIRYEKIRDEKRLRKQREVEIQNRKNEAARERSEQFAQWVNLSSSVFKFGSYVLWAVLFVVGVYLAINFVPMAIMGTIKFAALLFSFMTWSTILTALNILFWLTAFIIMCVCAYKYLPKISVRNRATNIFIVPFEIVSSATSSFFGWCGLVISGTIDFFKTLFEDNCPPIKITEEINE